MEFGEYCDDLPFPQRIVKNNQFEGIFPAADEKYELHCGEESFRNIKELYIIGGEYENIAKMLDCFGPSLEKVLFIYNQYIGELNRTVFHRFTNLETLDLEKSNLSNFDFSIIKSKQLHQIVIKSTQLKKVGAVSSLKTLTHLSI